MEEYVLLLYDYAIDADRERGRSIFTVRQCETPPNRQGTIMRKRWRALITVAALALLFWQPLPSLLPNHISTVLFFLTVTYGISLFFSSKLAIIRRFTTAYLAFIGLTYLVPAIFGLLPSGDLVEAGIWSGLVSPYLLVSFFVQMRHHYPYPASKTAFYFLPEGKHYLFSAAVVAVSVVAILAAFAMAKSNKSGYRIWLVLLGLSVVSLAGYAIVAVVSRGQVGVAIQTCWVASYIIAYVLARQGANLQEQGFLSEIEEW